MWIEYIWCNLPISPRTSIITSFFSSPTSSPASLSSSGAWGRWDSPTPPPNPGIWWTTIQTWNTFFKTSQKIFLQKNLRIYWKGIYYQDFKSEDNFAVQVWRISSIMKWYHTLFVYYAMHIITFLTDFIWLWK